MKATKATISKRIQEIVSLLINGEGREKIVQYSSEKWKIGERQADKYISKARKLIKEEVIKDAQYDFSKAIKRYEYLYKTALNEKNYRLALSINKELTVLQGLHKTVVEHSGNVEFISNIPD